MAEAAATTAVIGDTTRAKKPELSSTSRTSKESSNVNPLTRKLTKLLNSDKGAVGLNDDVLDGLRHLSSFFVHNTKRARQNLRGDLERRSLLVNKEFIESFQVVQEKLNQVQKDIESMAECCEDMTSRLNATRHETSGLINKTTHLQNQQQQVKLQETILELFLKRYQLTTEQKAALTSQQQVTEDFFTALNRVTEIHENCKGLLRTSHQRAGLDIMESMASLQEAAFEKLYRWTQATCRGFNTDYSVPEQSRILRCAMHALRSRPVLFEYAIDELGTTRKNTASRLFIDALTRGGPGGIPRPIELHAHDPVRYVSDMLAWLHQCIASERELLVHVLSSPAVADQVKGTPRVSDRLNALSDRDMEQLQKSLDFIMEGTCRPFKVRVEQVLTNEPGLVNCYKIANILQFYWATISDLVVATAALPALLDNLREETLKVFFDSLSHLANSFALQNETPRSDLSITPTTRSTLATLQDILASHDTMTEQPATQQQELAKMLSCVLDPLLEMCTQGGANLPSADMATYMINSIYAIQSTLTVYEFTDETVSSLEESMAVYTDKLAKEQCKYLVDQTGLGGIFLALGQWQATPEPRPPVSQHPGMGIADLNVARAKCDMFLSQGNATLIPQCNLLSSTRVRTAVEQAGKEQFIAAYTSIHQIITDPKSGYSEDVGLAKRTPVQIESLL